MSHIQTLSARNLAALEVNHRALLDLCLTMEELSSASAEEIEPAMCETVAERLIPLLTAAQQLEERALFERFASAADSTFGVRITEELKAEHRCDLHAAADALSALSAIKGNIAALDPSRHLLRGFAEALRRHINSERLMIETLIASEAEGRTIFTQ
jgi:hypothetical protein